MMHNQPLSARAALTFTDGMDLSVFTLSGFSFFSGPLKETLRLERDRTRSEVTTGTYLRDEN